MKFVNSAWVYCSQLTSQLLRAKKKKKITKRKGYFKLYPNTYTYRKEMILAHGHGTH